MWRYVTAAGLHCLASAVHALLPPRPDFGIIDPFPICLTACGKER